MSGDKNGSTETKRILNMYYEIFLHVRRETFLDSKSNYIFSHLHQENRSTNNIRVKSVTEIAMQSNDIMMVYK